MLKGISPLIPPALLKVLSEMGHGDLIVLADANYPAMSGSAKHVIRTDGVGIPGLLDGILKLFPLDSFIETPISMMAVVPGDDYVPDIWAEYRKIFRSYGIAEEKIAFLERFEFYHRAEHVYCVVATGERARYGNILLQKGVLEADE
jgi:L-fucose mutarotase